ncbi:MAG: hypothetical protein ACLGGV_00705 [Bacteroidia bacterium]
MKFVLTYLFTLFCFLAKSQAVIDVLNVPDTIQLAQKFSITLQYSNFTSTSKYVEKKQKKIDVLFIDSIKQSKQNLQLQTYDTGYVVLDPFMALNGNDTIISKPSLVYVNYAKVDMQKPEKSIFPNEELPLTFFEKLLLFFAEYWWILVLLILPGLVYFLFYLWKQKQLNKAKEIVVPIKPIHEEFIERIDAIKVKELWLKNKVKEHHSEITDAIRAYIENRYNINALELTSTQTIDLLRTVNLPTNQKENLKLLLNLADLVKFAKEQPSNQENERLIDVAKEFIIATKPNDNA